MDKHRAKIIGSITAAHFLLSVLFLFLTMGSSMSRFDGGGPSALAYSLLSGTFDVLCFPLLTALLHLKLPDTGMWGWLGVLANSWLWGWAGWRAILYWRSRRGAAQVNS